MKIIKTVIFISFAFLASCLKPMKAPVLKTSRIKIGTIKIAQIQIKNDQLILNGEFLNQIKSIKIQDNAVLSESFVIESQSGSKVIANGLQNLSLGVNALFDLVISSAAGAATYSIDFSLANGSVTGSKLSQMGAATGQVLTWDGSVWTPSTATASNIYLGAWDAAGDSPDLSSLAGNCGTSGEYYIASTANANVGFDSLVNISIGDWVICNNSGNWESISISSGVTTIDGMTDSDLTAPALDDVLVYDGVKWVNSKTKLSKLSDIDVGFAPNNLEVLTYDGTDWNAVSILSTIIAEGRLNDFHISALAASKLTGALPAIDGSNLTGITATDVSKLPLTGGALSGDLTVNANIITTGTVNGVNVTTLGASITANTTNIAANATAIIGKEATLAAGTVAQYYKGDKTWASFETSVLGSLLAGYTKAGAATAIVVGDTISQALGKLEYKVDNAGSGSGDFMKDGSVVMTGNLDLGNRKLVGNNGTAGIKIGSTGNVGIGVAGNPVYKLQVNGDAQISSDIEITGEASIQGMHFGKGHGGAGHSVGIGESVLGNTSDYNTAIGYRSMQTAGTGVKNTAIGASSFQSNGAGFQNTAIGYKSLNHATSSSSSSALGAYSLFNLTTGDNNTAIGSFSLKSETSGKENTGVGYKAAEKNNGDYNTAIGTLALFNSASGDLNTTIGYKSGHRLKTGSHSNVVIGSEAEGALVQSSGNVVIGHRAGEQITGADSADGVNRQKGRLIIANGNTASDTWIYGDSDHNIGIGINDPEKRLHLHKSSNAGPYLRITNDATTTGGTRGLIFGYNSENNLIFRNQENSKIIFNVNNNADDSLILASNGNVGIGTVAPSTKLHVQDYTTNYVSFVHNTRVDGHGLLVKAGDPAQVGKYPLAIQNRNDTNLLLVKSNGLVTMAGNVDSGVVTSITNTSNYANADGLEILAGGSTVESIPLNVKRRDGTALFKIYGNGTFFTHSGQASRKELKKNIRSLESEAMLLLREIKVVTYKYKVDEDSRADRIGFIANDDEHFYDDRLTNTRTGFDTPSIVGVMIKAFQEIENKVNSNIRMLETMQGLHTKVENNSRKIASLEDQVEQLKDHNQELEATNQEMKAFLCVKYSEAPFCH